MRNKLLASILTVCMLLTMLPVAAFAAETETEPGTEQTATATEQSDPVTEDAGNQTQRRMERMRGMPRCLMRLQKSQLREKLKHTHLSRRL